MSAVNQFIAGSEIGLDVTINETIVTSSTVIEFVAQPENGAAASFKKTLAAGGIVKVDDDTFTVVLNKADTVTLAPGVYKIQAIITDAGKERGIQFDPSFFEILERLDFS
jgi:hypothetical protein